MNLALITFIFDFEEVFGQWVRKPKQICWWYLYHIRVTNITNKTLILICSVPR